MIFRHVGQILVVLALLTLVPAIVALAGGRPDVALRYGVVIGLFAGLGAAGSRVRCTGRMQANEALVVSALAFVIPSVAMAFPLTAYGIGPVDALFEAVSGVTTTGLSTLASVEERPHTFLFARAWLQWVGGLGVLVLALAFMIPSGVAAKHLGFDDREAADYVGTTRGHARRVLQVYVTLTGIGLGLCLLVGMDAFDALAHTLAAISTGGFSTKDASLAAFEPGARWAVTLVSLAGAVSFALYAPRELRNTLRDARLWMLLGLTALGTGLLAFGMALGPSGADASTSQAVWMAVSAQSTSGFATLPLGDLSGAAKLALIGSMAVGGEVGSTAGGLKILRLLILAQVVLARVLRASLPKDAHLPLRISGTPVRSAEVEAAAALLFAYTGTIALSWLAFLAHGHDPLDALFEVVSATATAGLSAGPTGPDLAPLLKLVLCLDMWMGRVEIFAFLILLFPGTWLGRRNSAT